MSNSKDENFEKEESLILENPVEVNFPFRSDVIKSKNPGIQDSLRYKVEGSSKIYHEDLAATNRSSMKRPLSKESRIVTLGLIRYLEIERTIKSYGLEWTTTTVGSYYLTIV